MIKVGKWIAKHKILIILIGIVLLIPAYLGMVATRINYDVLSYLPDTLETVEGQDIMVDQFGMGNLCRILCLSVCSLTYDKPQPEQRFQ